ncbi:MAG TPA: hypothetical protein VGC80_15150, partial [Acetobacteraceae bacterium]
IWTLVMRVTTGLLMATGMLFLGLSVSPAAEAATATTGYGEPHGLAVPIYWNYHHGRRYWVEPPRRHWPAYRRGYEERGRYGEWRRRDGRP